MQKLEQEWNQTTDGSSQHNFAIHSLNLLVALPFVQEECRDCSLSGARLKIAGIKAMRALPIRQPYAELFLRGIKTVEYRSRSTRIIGERFHIYASKAKATKPIWSDDLRVAAPPKWMLELAEQVGMIELGALLPTGVIVGSAVIEKVTETDSGSTGSEQVMYRWHLADVERAKKFRKPRNHPPPVWFKPF